MLFRSEAARKHGLEATSLRVGQVCGSEESGAWNTSDWVPAIIKSSVTLKLIPDADGVSIYSALVNSYLNVSLIRR